MVTAFDMNDIASARTRHFRPLFEGAVAPDPEAGDWAAWQALLASTDYATDTDARDAMQIETDIGFGTLSSSLVALPSINKNDTKPVWLFANGAPGEASFEPVAV